VDNRMVTHSSDFKLTQFLRQKGLIKRTYE
jgi:hypothetical protein